MPVPKPTRIFHITAVANLTSIVANGGLRCKNVLTQRGLQYGNIAYQNIQARRAAKVVTVRPGGVIHDYVPFYFAPRSPMLFTINNGNVPGCPWTQEDIVHVETTVEHIAGRQLGFVFYDMNAALGVARPYNSIQDLDKVAWDLITENPRLDGYCKFWQSIHSNPRYVDRMEKRQAEFLVHGTVPLDLVVRIGVFDVGRRAQVMQALGALAATVPVEVKRDWYF